MNSDKNLPLEAMVFGAIALAALATRFLAVPWDFGGCFFQVCTSVVALIGFGRLLPRMKRLPRLLAGLTVVPIAGFLVFGSVYFAPQALFPFMLAGFAATGAIWLWSQAKVLPAALVGLLLLPLCAFCSYGARHIALLTRLRWLDGSAVLEVRFKPTGKEGEPPIVIVEPTDVASIAKSLARTSPYSPNRERIVSPWHCTIVLVDGSAHTFRVGKGRVGKGNRAHPEMVRIEFGVEVYQNPMLYRVLHDQNIMLWDHASESQHKEMPNKTSGADVK